jgi:hypothetical protein
VKKKKFQEHSDKIENMVHETSREMLASIGRVAMDLEQRMNQRMESVNEEIKIISERTNGQIQMLTETLQSDKAQTNNNNPSKSQPWRRRGGGNIL